MVETMTRCMDSFQRILTGWKCLAVGHFDICHRHALATEGVSGNVQARAQGLRSPHMVRVSVRDENAPDAAAFIALSHECIEIRCIINRRIDNDCTLVSTAPAAQHNSIGAWPRHDGWIGGQDDGIGCLHVYFTPCAYVQAFPRCCPNLLVGIHALSHLPASARGCALARGEWRNDPALP